jgi:hypothetical protein
MASCARKEPSFGSALAEGVSGDTLLQQTSVMVEHRRPGWWPGSRLGGAYSFRNSVTIHTPRSGRRRALVEFPSGGKKAWPIKSTKSTSQQQKSAVES